MHRQPPEMGMFGRKPNQQAMESFQGRGLILWADHLDISHQCSFLDVFRGLLQNFGPYMYIKK